MTESIEEIESLLNQLDDCISQSQTAKSIEEKRKLDSQIRTLLRKTKSSISYLCAELKRTPESINKSVCMKQVTECDKKVKQYEETVKNASKPKPKITQNNQDKNSNPNDVQMQEFGSAREVLDVGVRINNDTLDALKRIEKNAIITEDIGIETNKMLARQGEVIVHVDEELQHLETNIQRAGRDVKWFARQMAGDKCCLTMFGLVVLGLVGIVFYVIYKKKN